jgi:SAM-dependent methyltransferase
MAFTYSEKFYNEMVDTSVSSAEVVVPLVLASLAPHSIQSVIDVGCGEGRWLSVFKKNGVTKVFGVDGTPVTKERLAIAIEEFKQVDFEKPFALDKKADLAMSLEVAEHLPNSKADGFVETLTSLAPVVLFSAAIPHQGGSHHINEQWPEYWEKKFKARGYVPVDIIRRKVWNDPRVSFFYAQNVLIYVRESVLSAYPTLLSARQHGLDTPLALVHPHMYEYYAGRWKLLVPFLGKIPVGVLHATKRTLQRFRKK